MIHLCERSRAMCIAQEKWQFWFFLSKWILLNKYLIRILWIQFLYYSTQLVGSFGFYVRGKTMPEIKYYVFSSSLGWVLSLLGIIQGFEAMGWILNATQAENPNLSMSLFFLVDSGCSLSENCHWFLGFDELQLLASATNPLLATIWNPLHFPITVTSCTRTSDYQPFCCQLQMMLIFLLQI